MKEGIQRIEQKGYELVYPDEYLEAQAEKEKEWQEEGKTQEIYVPGAEIDEAELFKQGIQSGINFSKYENIPLQVTGENVVKAISSKRKKSGSTSTDEENWEEESEVKPKAKKPKIAFKLTKEWKEMMDADEANATLWKEVQAKEVSNEKEFCDAVEEALTCMICMDVVFKPVTTPCHHNACLVCLERSFAAETFNCPSCRAELGKEFLKDKKKIVNNNLKKILNQIFPGYEAGR